MARNYVKKAAYLLSAATLAATATIAQAEQVVENGNQVPNPADTSIAAENGGENQTAETQAINSADTAANTEQNSAAASETAPVASTETKVEEKTEISAETKTETKTAETSQPSTETKTEAKPEEKTESKTETATDKKAETKTDTPAEKKTEEKTSTNDPAPAVPPVKAAPEYTVPTVPVVVETPAVTVPVTTPATTANNTGLVKPAVLVETPKKESITSSVDNGEAIQGTYKAIVKPILSGEQHPMYTALKALGFEVGTLGSHELTSGLDYLKKVIDTTSLPLVNTNVVDFVTGKFLYEPYKIIYKTFTDNKGRKVTLKIGVTGIVSSQIFNLDKVNLDGKLRVKDSAEALQNIIPSLRQQGANVIFVVSHSSDDNSNEKDEETLGYPLASLTGVEAFLANPSYAGFLSGMNTSFSDQLKSADEINSKISKNSFITTEKYSSNLGIVDLNLSYNKEKWQVPDSKSFAHMFDTQSNTADEKVTLLAKETEKQTADSEQQEVGVTTAPINSYFSLVQDDPSIQIVNNAQLWYAKKELAGTAEADLPILSAAAPSKTGTEDKNASNYTDIPAGNLAVKNAADLYPYDNVAAVLKITGAQLKEWLEMSAGQFNTINPDSTDPQQLVNQNYPTYNFDVIDGVTYKFDITQPNKYDLDGNLVNPTASRVRELQYQGKDVEPNQEFIVITNNYRANGNFPGVKDASFSRLLNLENRQAIVDYIEDTKFVNPIADNNWSFTDSIKGSDLRFLTADQAKNSLNEDGILTYVAPATARQGFGEFKYTYTDPQTENVPIVQSSTKENQALSSADGYSSTGNSSSNEEQAELLTLQQSQKKISLPTKNINPKSETLPLTGEKSSVMTIIGAATMSTLAFFGIRDYQKTEH